MPGVKHRRSAGLTWEKLFLLPSWVCLCDHTPFGYVRITFLKRIVVHKTHVSHTTICIKTAPKVSHCFQLEYTPSFTLGTVAHVFTDADYKSTLCKNKRLSLIQCRQCSGSQNVDYLHSMALISILKRSKSAFGRKWNMRKKSIVQCLDFCRILHGIFFCMVNTRC